MVDLIAKLRKHIKTNANENVSKVGIDPIVNEIEVASRRKNRATYILSFCSRSNLIPNILLNCVSTMIWIYNENISVI